MYIHIHRYIRRHTNTESWVVFKLKILSAESLFPLPPGGCHQLSSKKVSLSAREPHTTWACGCWNSHPDFHNAMTHKMYISNRFMIMLN